eukprot:jgi/Ulvmu1/6126/UM027_0104.1
MTADMATAADPQFDRGEQTHEDADNSCAKGIIDAWRAAPETTTERIMKRILVVLLPTKVTKKTDQAMRFYGEIIGLLLRDSDEGVSTAEHLIQAVLPLACAKDALTRTRLCMLIDQTFKPLPYEARAIVAVFDDLLPAMLQLASLDNIASVRAAALPPLSLWSGPEQESVQVKVSADKKTRVTTILDELKDILTGDTSSVVRAAAVRALGQTTRSGQLLIHALNDENVKVREAAAQQLLLLCPSVTDLSLSQRCAVVRAAQSTYGLVEVVSSWHASVDVHCELPPQASGSGDPPDDSHTLKVVEMAREQLEDADLQVVARAVVLVSHMQPLHDDEITASLIELLIDSADLLPRSLAAVAAKHSSGFFSPDLLSPTEAVFWCTACSYLKQTSAAAQAQEQTRRQSVESMSDAADAIAPASATEWCDMVRRHVQADPPRWHAAGSMLAAMPDMLNCADAATAAATLTLCRDLVAWTVSTAPSEEASSSRWAPAVMSVASAAQCHDGEAWGRWERVIVAIALAAAEPADALQALMPSLIPDGVDTQAAAAASLTPAPVGSRACDGDAGGGLPLEQSLQGLSLADGPPPAETAQTSFATALSCETSFASATSRAVSSSQNAASANQHAPRLAAAPPSPPSPQSPTCVSPALADAVPPALLQPADAPTALQQLAFFRELLVLLPPSLPTLDPDVRVEVERLLPLCMQLAAGGGLEEADEPAHGEEPRPPLAAVRQSLADVAVACIGQLATSASWHACRNGRDAQLWAIGTRDMLLRLRSILEDSDPGARSQTAAVALGACCNFLGAAALDAITGCTAEDGDVGMHSADACIAERPPDGLPVIDLLQNRLAWAMSHVFEDASGARASRASCGRLGSTRRAGRQAAASGNRDGSSSCAPEAAADTGPPPLTPALATADAMAHTLCELLIHSSTHEAILEPRERERVLAALLATSSTTSPRAGAPAPLVHQRIKCMRDMLPCLAAKNKLALVHALVPAARRAIAAGEDRSAAATLVQEVRRQLGLLVVNLPQGTAAARQHGGARAAGGDLDKEHDEEEDGVNADGGAPDADGDQAATACAAHVWVYPLVLVALYECATAGVTPRTRDYLKALLATLRRLPLQVLTLPQAQHAAALAWRADEALFGQVMLLRDLAAVRDALAAAMDAAAELSCAPQATLQRGAAEVQAALEEDLRSHVDMDELALPPPSGARAGSTGRAASVGGSQNQRPAAGAASSSDDSDFESGPPPARRSANMAASSKPRGRAATGRAGMQPLQENQNSQNVAVGGRGSASRAQPRRAARTHKAMVDAPELPSSSSSSGEDATDSDDDGSADAAVESDGAGIAPAAMMAATLR